MKKEHFSPFNKHPEIAIVLGFQLFRLVLLPFFGLMPQDAYYHFYGENLALSYFDHPGMIGYILRIFTELFGKTVFVVKLADFVVSSFTLFSFFQLAGNFLPKHKQLRALVLTGSTLFVSVLSFNSTPDVPLLLFWTLSINSLYLAIFKEKKLHWLLGGFLMGLAFNSKYTALLLPIGLLGFLCFSKKYKKELFSPWLLSCLLIGAGVTFPVWYWNYQHDFASFLFQSSERTGSIARFKISPSYFFGAIGHQLFLLLPILLIAFVKIGFKHLRNLLLKFKTPSDSTLFLLAFFIPTFFGFFLITPIYWVKMNWMLPSYITGVILCSHLISKKQVKIHLGFSIAFHLIVAIEIVTYAVPIKSDDTWVGWKTLAQETIKLQEAHPNSFVFSDDNYKTSAVLSFYLDQKIYAQNILYKPALQFDYLGDNLTLLAGKDGLFIDSDKRFKNNKKRKNTPKELELYFAEVKQLDPIIVKRGQREIRKFWVFHCKNYQPKKQ